MEQIWLTRGCVRPCHIVRWYEFETGYRFYDAEMLRILLWYKSGRLLGPRKKKIKGKGWTYICKNYGLYARMKVVK